MKRSRILRELGDHLPFTIFFTAAGIILAALLTYGSIIAGAHEPKHGHPTAYHHEVEQREGHEAGKDTQDESGREGEKERATVFIVASHMIFHIFHPVHLLLSAMATTAMFFRFERRVWKAVLTGFIGAVGVCSLSDIFMPYLCGNLLEVKEMRFHWCLIEHPQMVLPFVALGIVSGLLAAGVVARSTIISHSAHVFVSSTASLFYLISFGVPGWYGEDRLPLVFAIVILCVTIPCCLSDIIFPLLVAREEGELPHLHAHEHPH